MRATGLALALAVAATQAVAQAPASLPMVDQCVDDARARHYDRNFGFWIERADAGDAQAAYYTACLLLQGPRIEDDVWEPALGYFEQARKAGFPEGGYALATLSLGLQAAKPPVPVPGDAMAMLRAAADAGLPLAQYRLARALIDGQLVPADADAGRAWLLRAALRGSRLAQGDLGALLLERPGGREDIHFALGLLRMAWRQGNAAARATLEAAEAASLDRRFGASPDERTALEQVWETVRGLPIPKEALDAELDRIRPLAARDHPTALLIQAAPALRRGEAEQGLALLGRAIAGGEARATSTLAMIHLGYRSASGFPWLALPPGSPGGLLWAQQAEFHGLREGATFLIEAAAKSERTPGSTGLAGLWRARLAEIGHSELGAGPVMRVRPKPSLQERRDAEARFQTLAAFARRETAAAPVYLHSAPADAPPGLEAAAEAGDALARLWLSARLAARGERDRAIAWLARAAAQGMPEAQAALGEAHLDGAGVAADRVSAYVWHSLALRGGWLASYYNRPALDGAERAAAEDRIARFASVPD